MLSPGRCGPKLRRSCWPRPQPLFRGRSLSPNILLHWTQKTTQPPLTSHGLAPEQPDLPMWGPAAVHISCGLGMGSSCRVQLEPGAGAVAAGAPGTSIHLMLLKNKSSLLLSSEGPYHSPLKPSREQEAAKLTVHTCCGIEKRRKRAGRTEPGGYGG